MPKKQDVIVQGGYLYVPDIQEGKWRRMQSYFDVAMNGAVTTTSEALYVKNSEGNFVEED